MVVLSSIRIPTRRAMLAGIALVTACGSGSPTTGNGSAIALSLSPTGATIQQGGSTQVTGTVVRTNFTGDITIGITGAPTGVTGTVTVAPVNGSSTAQVTLSASGSTVVGTYTVSVTASGNGVSSASASFTLTIAPATPASFALALGSPALTIALGGSSNSTIQVTRTSFTGSIAFAADNMPAGATATFTPPETNDVAGSVLLTIPSSVPVGTYNVLIRGTAAGLTDATAPLSLTVTPEPRTLAVETGDGQSGEVALPLANPVVARVTRVSDGSGVAGVTVSFAVTAGGGSLSAASGITGADGRTSVTWTMGSVSGPQTVSVSSAGLVPATAAATATSEVRLLAFETGNGQSGNTGLPLPQPVVARVTRQRDGAGVAGVTVAFSILTGGGSVNHATVVTGSDGRASVQWTVGPVGAQSLQANSAGLTPVTATATATPLVRVLAFESGGGQSGTAGLALPQPLVARVTRQQDGAGVSGVSIGFTVLAGGGSVDHATVLTGADGRATVQWTLGPIGPQSLQGSSAGFTSVTATATAFGPGLSGIVSISAGDSHACALTATGVAYCWGSDSWGELGDPSVGSNYSAAPRLVAGGHTWASVSGGYSATCARTTGGNASCWGEGQYGGLGNGGTSFSATPTPVTQSSQTFAHLISGSYFHCGLTPGSQAWCWGDNSYGELGDNTTVQRNMPTAVSGGLSFAEIVGHPSGYSVCGRTTAGAAYCWGYNGDKELGDGTTTDRKVPTAVSGGDVFTALSGGSQHMCGMLAGGSWKCWGYNGYGELGDGTETDRSTPTSVLTGGQLFVQLALGNDHTCGRTAAGAVFCWGRNGSGELGTGDHSESDTPIPSAGGMLFTDIRAGNGFTCGLTSGGSVFCWGDNSWGQLGDDVVNSSSTPLRVPAPSGSNLRRRR